jgi:metallo-beta-lactamase class B
LRAVWTPGHTPGCTTWTTTVEDRGKPYAIVFQACGGPNAGVKLIGNVMFPSLIEDTLRSFRVQKTLKPDIYLPMHPESLFAGKVERIKAGETPHPLMNPEGYSKLINETEANFQKRIEEERAKTPIR